MDNRQVARLLKDTADMIAITGGNSFKVSSYARAGRTIEMYTGDIGDLVARDRVQELDGVGKSIARELRKLHDTGELPLYEKLKSELPDKILDLVAIQGLGPKKIKVLYEELGVGSLSDLDRVLEEGSIEKLSGFGKKTQENLRRELERLRRQSGRTPLPAALAIAQPILQALRALPQVERADIAGSARRMRDFVGDLDFLAASDDPEPVMAAFRTMEGVIDVIGSGSTKTSVHLTNDLQADLRVVPPNVYGAALHHFTGSKEHNVEMRSRGRKMGLKISEYGVHLHDDPEAPPLACATEEDVFKCVGLTWIPPEIREGAGEIEAALDDMLPDLLELEDMRGDLHTHTDASDGMHTIDEMVEAARSRGYEYLAITDHSKSSFIANGLDEERLAHHVAAIREANEKYDDIRVLAGIEVDILPGGDLDFDGRILDDLDWVVGSVHNAMKQDKNTMTGRLLQAISSGHIHALGHPTGRMLGRRDGYELHFEDIIEACKKYRVALEINGSYGRLDLNDKMARQAAEAGVPIVVNTDAHSTRALDNMSLGVGTARRAWLEPYHVLNTRPWDELMAWFAER